MDINRATIVGRLTRDPEVRTTPSGINVTSFGVATNFAWNDPAGGKKESVEFHNIVAWRRLGEIVAQYMRKGSRILVEGRLQTNSWQGQDGVKRSRTEIVADNVIMLDSKSGGAGAPQAFSPARPISTRPGESGEENVIQVEENPAPPREQPASVPSESVMNKNEEEISVEDIPF